MGSTSKPCRCGSVDTLLGTTCTAAPNAGGGTAGSTEGRALVASRVLGRGQEEEAVAAVVWCEPGKAVAVDASMSASCLAQNSQHCL